MNDDCVELVTALTGCLQFKLEFIPMEDDLLSLEMDDASRDIYLVCSTHLAAGLSTDSIV